MTIELTGKLSGSVDAHTPETLAATWDHAYLTLPDEAGDGYIETTPAEILKTKVDFKCPTVLFAHGSSGVNPAIRELAQWLSTEMGAACVVPDSMQTADRLTYTSPVARQDYERIHAMRSQELAFAATQLQKMPWFDGNYVVAGTSEGGVTAARFDGNSVGLRESGKMIFSWSCEENYFVDTPGNVFEFNEPVLSVMSLTDKFFGVGNSYLDNPKAYGYPHEALKDNVNASIVLLPQAPHTLLNLPQAHGAIQAFLVRVWLDKYLEE